MGSRLNRKQTVEQRAWNSDVEPLMKHLVGRRHGIRTGQAKEVGRRFIDYFRGSDFVKWVKANRTECKRLAPKLLAQLPEEAVNDVLDAQEIGNLLLTNGFVYRAQWQAPKSKTQETVKRPKWPNKLAMTQAQTFDENSFYVIQYEGDKTWRYIFLGILIVAVLTVVMWPAWPLAAKTAIWSIVLVLLMSIWVIIAVRLVVFSLFWFAGVDFWIMPNLFNEEVGLIDTFLPTYSWQRRGDDWYMVLARLATALLSAGAIYQLGQTHSVSDIYGFANRSFIDIYEWGQKKITDEPHDPRKAYPTVEDFERDDDLRPSDISSDDTARTTAVPGMSEVDMECIEGCGFHTTEQLTECKEDCTCMKNLFESKCLAGCAGEFRRFLGDIRDEVCDREEEEEEDVSDQAE